VVYYRDALCKGAAEVQSRKILTTNLFIELVQVLKASQAGIRRLPGTRIANPASGKTVYTPPEGEERIRELLGNLEHFANEDSDGLDPLVKAALIHYQFEAIHPFHDGNGRVGRIILILFLLSRGLLDQPVLFVSRYIIEHKSDYYRLLRGVTG
jgi:Fic family protein